MTGITDPLDYRLVESYWLGGGVGADLDPGEFFDALLAIIGPQAGQLLVASHAGSGARGGRQSLLPRVRGVSVDAVSGPRHRTSSR